MYAATQRVIEILLQHQPEAVFVPYHKEAHVDHYATSKIVLSALRASRKPVTVYEYPVWFWQFWPWVRAPQHSMWSVLKWLQDSCTSGWGLLQDFRCGVYIGDALALKRAALDQHTSQMTRLLPDSRWLTLADVAQGDFLTCFFQEYEVFYRYSVNAG
jgi:LmbE family N-acetylglucosaminyl deacetylase